MKRDVDNRVKVLRSTRGLLYCLKISCTLVHKWVKTGPEFSCTLHEFCVLLRRRALHTDVSKSNPTKLCQTEGDKWPWCEPNKVAPHSECKYTIEIRSLVSRSHRNILH